MMYLIGFAMMGGYFGVINIVIPFMEMNYPNITSISFVSISAIYACLAMKLQTRVERFYISRHVGKNPNSTWRYTSFSQR